MPEGRNGLNTNINLRKTKQNAINKNCEKKKRRIERKRLFVPESCLKIVKILLFILSDVVSCYKRGVWKPPFATASKSCTGCGHCYSFILWSTQRFLSSGIQFAPGL